MSQIGGDNGKITTKFNMGAWIGSWNRKRILVEFRRDLNEVSNLANSIVSMLVCFDNSTVITYVI